MKVIKATAVITGVYIVIKAEVETVIKLANALKCDVKDIVDLK